MGGYLERVVDSGMTSLRDVRGSMASAPVDRDSEEQQVAAPFARDETVSELTPAWPALRPDARLDSPSPAVSLPPDMTFAPRDASHDAPATHVQSPGHPALDAASPTRPPEARLDPRSPAVSLPPAMTSAPRDASYDAPPTHVQPLGGRALDAAPPTRPPEARIEELPVVTVEAASPARRAHETVPAMPPDARGTDVHARPLKDAGIRSVRGVWSRDEAPAATGAHRQRPVAFEVTVQPLDRVAPDDGVNHQLETSRPGHPSAGGDRARPSRHPGVPAARVEQWRRLKDKLLIEHYPGTSNSNVPFKGVEHNASPPTNTNSTGREIVIEQLEVVVAAPHPASPPPAPGPSALPPRSGAWSVATRRYLGKL